MDFLFWIDINKVGINKIRTILGSILNVGEPILYVIKYLYYKPDISTLQNY
jgi:hypothetical protein